MSKIAKIGLFTAVAMTLAIGTAAAQMNNSNNNNNRFGFDGRTIGNTFSGSSVELNFSNSIRGDKFSAGEFGAQASAWNAGEATTGVAFTGDGLVSQSNSYNAGEFTAHNWGTGLSGDNRMSFDGHSLGQSMGESAWDVSGFGRW